MRCTLVVGTLNSTLTKLMTLHHSGVVGAAPAAALGSATHCTCCPTCAHTSVEPQQCFDGTQATGHRKHSRHTHTHSSVEGQPSTGARASRYRAGWQPARDNARLTKRPTTVDTPHLDVGHAHCLGPRLPDHHLAVGREAAATWGRDHPRAIRVTDGRGIRPRVQAAPGASTAATQVVADARAVGSWRPRCAAREVRSGRCRECGAAVGRRTRRTRRRARGALAVGIHHATVAMGIWRVSVGVGQLSSRLVCLHLAAAGRCTWWSSRWAGARSPTTLLREVVCLARPRQRTLEASCLNS